jgi:glycosyltransferase involved in cell wall biosynthesis
LHEWFGRWAAKEVARENWDVIHCWSGVSEELLSASRMRSAVTLLMRGSAHIGAQDDLLREEEARSGEPVNRPSAWMVERELREYRLADQIVVLSSFARRTFLERGFDAGRVSTLPLGVDASAFQASQAARGARVQRILGGEPLRVLYVGALSFRKGLLDLVRAAQALQNERVRFTLVGPILDETRRLLADVGTGVQVCGKVPQSDLPALYAAADVFLFPTIEDGFGMVLTQASASGLPIVTTPNSAGPDFIAEGESGWIVPIRDSEAIADRLRWCSSNRKSFAAMVSALNVAFPARDWRDVAQDLTSIARHVMTETSVHE